MMKWFMVRRGSEGLKWRWIKPAHKGTITIVILVYQYLIEWMWIQTGVKILDNRGRDSRGRIFITEKKIKKDKIYKIFIFYEIIYIFLNVFKKLRGGPNPPNLPPSGPHVREYEVLR
jgi:hypothetical protein